MTATYIATWLATNTLIRLSSNSLQLAWEEAIECFKDDIVRELLPTFLISPEESQAVPTFKDLTITRLLKVEKAKQFQVNVFRSYKEPEVFFFDQQPLTYIREKLNMKECLPASVELWITESLVSGELYEFIFKLGKSKENSIVVSVAYN